MKNKLRKLQAHLQTFKEDQFIADLNAVLGTNISEITIETALMTLEVLDSILLDTASQKKIDATPTCQTQIPPFYLKLKQHIVDTRTQISRDLFLAIPQNEFDTLSAKKDIHFQKTVTDFNNFSFNLILFVAKGKSKEKALLRINHLIDMAGMAIENKCFHDVFAFSAALNDITIQSLCKKYKFSESRRKILERLNIVTNEYDNCMNLHHITFEDAIPSLNVYAGQVGKGKEMSGAGVSLFKSGLISLQKANRRLLARKNVTPFPSPDFDKISTVKELVNDAGGWEYIANKIDTLPIEEFIKENSRTVLEQISTDHLLKVACDIEIKLSSAEEEYESEIDDLEIDAFNRESNLSIADMKKEDGFAEYLVAYDKITGDHHVELINLQSKIRMNPQDRSVLEKQETLRDQKEQALEALHKKTPNATRFYSLAKIIHLETKIRELHCEKTIAETNLAVAADGCISAVSLLSLDYKKPFLLAVPYQRMKTGICEKICKFLDSAQPDFKPFNIDYEKAISELHEMIRINYSRKSESKMFRGIQELVKAFGDNSKTDKKLGSRQEMETLLEQLIANDQNAVARVNQSLNIALVLTPSIISQLKKLKELVTQESALKQVLRELGLRYTVKDKLQYLNGLKRGEENLSEEAWEQIEVLKASLWAMNPKMLTQTESYRKMGPNSRFFKLLGETVTSHPCITSVVEQSLP